MKKWIRAVLAGTIILALILFGIFAAQNTQKSTKPEQNPEEQNTSVSENSTSDENTAENSTDDPDIIVKDNVKVITNEMKSEDQPTEVSDNSLTFEKDPGYQTGDVLVAGEISAAPSGFIRKVVQTEKTNQGYRVETEPATLLDVFEKAHIIKQFRLTEDGASETGNNSAYIIKRLSEDESEEETEEENSDYDYSVSINVEEEPIQFSGEAGWGCWLELQIDIEDGEVQCGIAVRSKAGISLECGANSEKEFEKEKTVYERKLPNIEFNAGIVPIVITNHMEAVVGAAGSLEGGIHSSYGATADSTLGFQYDSRTGKVEEVKEGNLNSDGLEWSTVEVNGRLEAYIDIRLSAKLYDSAGLNLSGGAVGKAEGQAKVSMKDDLGGYAGSLELSISPRIKGKAVVDIPVIDKKMQETDLFDRTFDPIWSKHWESSADWQKDMEWTETGEQGDIYVTRYGEVNQCDSTAFQFEIPKGWEIQTEEVGGPMDAVRENVVLTNDRGVTVSFWYCQGALGGYSRDMLKAQVSQADTSNFVPGYPWGTDRDCSDLGEFMVARVHITGEMMAGIDDDYVPVDSTLFAVIPTSRLGEIEFAGQAGDVDEFSFDYPTPVAFIAEAPDGTFTEKEEEQVIRILKSFKVAELD